MAQDEQDLIEEIEEAVDRELTELEKEFVGILTSHHEHIIALEKKVAALETLVKAGLPNAIRTH